jgi:hypothetical protein
MACGCSKASGGGDYATGYKKYSVMGNFGYLSKGQINKRLEIFKRIHCNDCTVKNTCDYAVYSNCEKSKI